MSRKPYNMTLKSPRARTMQSAIITKDEKQQTYIALYILPILLSGVFPTGSEKTWHSAT